MPAGPPPTTRTSVSAATWACRGGNMSGAWSGGLRSGGTVGGYPARVRVIGTGRPSSATASPVVRRARS